MSEQRVLPADVYDTLEFSALVFHGIGQPNVFTDARNFGTGGCGEPVCILGHAAFATDTNSGFHNRIGYALHAAGVAGRISDETVRRINARKKVSQYARVSWEEFTRELNIVRGN
jgi:hypothetical protein